MKAIVQDKYGPPYVLELADIDKPVITDDMDHHRHEIREASKGQAV